MLKNLCIVPKASKNAFANSIEAWVPAHWANESMALLVENMQIAALVHRDFEDALAENGDTVNTRKPGTFTTKRKTLNSSVAIQNISVTNIPVVLNQHLYNTFLVRDRENARSFKDLTQEYLKPAMLDIASSIDRLLLGQAPRFLRTDGKTAGSLGVDASVASILETRKNMNDSKVPLAGRNLIIGTKDEAALLALEIFINADKVGDNGTALREASLGRRLGFDVYCCQNVCAPTTPTDKTTTLLVNNALGYVAGTTVMTVDGVTGAVVTGQWFKTTDLVPHTITGHTENTAGNTISITFSPPLKTAVLDNAILTRYTECLINQSSTAVTDSVGDVILAATGYPAGWEEAIAYDGNTIELQVGQFINLGAGLAAASYNIIAKPSSTTILLDRPLDAAVADNSKIFPGPAGVYNFAFVREAMALVTRPMALPPPDSGAKGAVANYANISVRVVWSYNSRLQGTLVTVDVLAGVAILESAKGEVMLG